MWLLILLGLLTSKICFAQDASPSATLFSQYQTDYLHWRDLYNQSYLVFIDKKNTHTKYQTLTTKQERLDAAIKTFITRNTMLVSYLRALRAALEISQPQNPTDTEKVQIEISQTENWLNEQNTILSSINNDNDVDRWVEEFKNKHIEIQQFIYTALIQNEINSRTKILNDIIALNQSLSIPTNISLPVKSDLIKSALKAALATTQKKQNANRFNNFYPEAKQEIIKADSYLAELLSDLKAIIIKRSQ